MTKMLLSCLNVVVACSLVQSSGCGKQNPTTWKPDVPSTSENHAPEAVGSIPSQDLTIGEEVVLTASRYFRDEDGDPLMYSTESSNESIANATVSGSSVTIRPVSPGSASVTVTATDSQGLSVSQSIRVHVTEALPPLTGPYTPLDWIRISAGRIEIHGISVGFIDCIPLDATVNNVRYKVHQSHWQWRENPSSPWTDISDTRKTGAICSYTPEKSGEYKLVMDMSIDGIRGRYSSSNTIKSTCVPILEECYFS